MIESIHYCDIIWTGFWVSLFIVYCGIIINKWNEDCDSDLYRVAACIYIVDYFIWVIVEMYVACKRQAVQNKKLIEWIHLILADTTCVIAFTAQCLGGDDCSEHFWFKFGIMLYLFSGGFAGYHCWRL